ncbi:MAG: cytochrome c3 family protein, partial [Candidatus Omnitrophica bacterium]|nr:cytochrome c3 family protein [Candidatus Omnitrophota bacterium]
MILRHKYLQTILFCAGVFSVFIVLVLAQAQENPSVKPSVSVADNDTCLTCHADKDTAPFVDQAFFKASKHGGQQCVDCHADLAKSDFPHHTPAPVNCGGCHADQQAQFMDSLHGKALIRGDKLAPRCQNCHGSHDIISVKDKKSKVSALKIPFVCGSCHSEGKPVQVQRTIHEDHILENYSESIHGEGLFKKGLNVTATCASCHHSHQILPHTDPRSSIARKNIVETCLKCHSQIEEVHRKIIKGDLWEKDPQRIPVCVDCHQPHKARRVFYDQGVADNDCLTCHAKKDLVAADGRSMFVNADEPKNSIHAKVSCAQCHTEVSPSKARACETITKKVDCAACHSDQGLMYQRGIHGQMVQKKDPNAPRCTDCHGTHEILSQKNILSPTYPTNVPSLCARCHQENKKAAMMYKGTEHNITTNYNESIHGKGLLKSGLVVTATCTSCHTAHEELPAGDSASSVNRNNIAATCGKCHKGVFERFRLSVHATAKVSGDEKLPVCSDCHTAHTIKRTDMDNFKFEMMNVCGKCHMEIASTYFETFHGKAIKLGYTKAAKCADCHGSHDILPVDNPHSSLSRENIIGTCQKCHAGATRRFAGYLTHATHHDPKKYPWVFWTFWAMTSLLIFTFTISTLHTLLWLPKSLQMRREHPPKPYDPAEKQYLRFPVLYRVMHACMIISFLTLTITGMTLKFSYMPWA